MPPIELGILSSTNTLELALGAAAFDTETEEAGDKRVKPVLAVTGTVSFDIPIVEHESVDHWVQFLQKRGRRWFAKWLARSTRLVPIFYEIIDQYGLPRDLVFLAMIESGFSTKARSIASAVGPWQFMPRTGRRYGLRVGFWVDERHDFEKATHAACRLLSTLHRLFDGDWFKAWAAYNAGAGRVRRAMRRSGMEDYWKMIDSRYLARETKNYVPKMIAAAKISKAPHAYGFEGVSYLPLLQWDTLTTTVARDLKSVAQACGEEDVARLEQLNPELRTGVTPPGRAYPLRVPVGSAAACKEGLAQQPLAERMTFRYFQVNGDDSLEEIAKRHHTTAERILVFNEIKKSQLYDFDELVIPVPLMKSDRVAIVEPDLDRPRGGYGPSAKRLLVYRVRSGDSLWKISRRFKVGLKKLRAWNGMWRHSNLRIGQKLKIYLGG